MRYPAPPFKPPQARGMCAVGFSQSMPLANTLGNGVLGTARLKDAPFPEGAPSLPGRGSAGKALGTLRRTLHGPAGSPALFATC